MNFWDDKFNKPEYIYGKEPNKYLKESLDNISPGKLLLPGEGEGRNAVYAAKTFWEVDAFDYSDVAQEKALKLAKENDVEINYQILAAEDFEPKKKYDAIALIYLHLPAEIRTAFHKKIMQALNPGGKLICEFFEKSQINFDSGGPKNIDMLYDIETLEGDFNSLKIDIISKVRSELNEGPLHQGEARLLRMIATK